tara:strand:- start:1400 stop:2266 length:867 start_codon:yes stop_codon:yes gene_type:complete
MNQVTTIIIRFSCFLLIVCSTTALSQVDIAGHWRKPNHEEHGSEAEIGDYTGLPLNDAARIRADTWNPERLFVPEHQCEPHPSPYAPVGPSNMRIWPEVDPFTQEIIAWHMVLHWMEMHRIIWMDGRDHPPVWAPHTWMGFSTGEWNGDSLTVTTTHIKPAWTRRNGAPQSDQAVMREHWMRHGDVLTLVSVLEDPLYLEEPLIRSLSWETAPGYQVGSYPCHATVEVEHPDGYVPFNLPGQNSMLKDNVVSQQGFPFDAIRGGAKTLLPEYSRELEAMRIDGNWRER